MKVQCTKCGTEIDRTVRLSTVVCFHCKQFYASLRKFEEKKARLKKPIKHRVKKVVRKVLDCNIIPVRSDMGYFIKGVFYPTKDLHKSNNLV